MIHRKNHFHCNTKSFIKICQMHYTLSKKQTNKKSLKTVLFHSIILSSGLHAGASLFRSSHQLLWDNVKKIIWSKKKEKSIVWIMHICRCVHTAFIFLAMLWSEIINSVKLSNAKMAMQATTYLVMCFTKLC